MRIPLLKYSQLSEIWQVLQKNTDPSSINPIASKESIYCVFEDNILRKYSPLGIEELISICQGPINLDNSGNILYVKNNTIEPLGISNVNLFTCNEKNVFFSRVFDDKEMIIRFDSASNTEDRKSKLINNIKQIECYQNFVITSDGQSLYVFDSNLQLVNTIQTDLISNFDCVDNFIVVINDNGSQTKIAAYLVNSETKTTTWSILLDGNLVNFVAGERFSYCAIEFYLYCLTMTGKINWQKETLYSISPFKDVTEHVVAASDRVINIYESETGILVWKAEISKPICGNAAIHEFGFAMTSYGGGGIHYFGRKNLWDEN